MEEFMSKEEYQSVFLETLKKQIAWGHVSVKDFITHESIAQSFTDELEKYEKSQEKLQAFNTISTLLHKHFPTQFQGLLEEMRKG